MKIEEMGLDPVTEQVAHALQAAHPDVVFTSGRRDVAAQASAMAHNVMRNRHWIVQTYVATPESQKLQHIADQHAGAGVALLQGVFAMEMSTWTDAERAKVSKHFSGQAFDVEPVPGPAGEAIKATIRSLPGVVKFLDHEGGLERWHAQTA